MARPLPVRPEIAGALAYGAPHPDVPIRLNVNENPYPTPPEVVIAIGGRVKEVARTLNRYPDRDFVELRTRLAAYLATEAEADFLTAENVWAANGSNEVMLHVLQAYGGPGRGAVGFDPTYSMYPEYARDTFTTWVPGSRRDDFTLDLEATLDHIATVRPSVIFLTSPNNPTGTPLPLEQIEAICEAVAVPYSARDTVLAQAPGRADGGPTAVVIVDEAYAEFRRPGRPSAVSLLPTFSHLAVTRTMSKAFGLAGGRIGYLVAAPDFIAPLRTVRLPYHLSAVTQATAIAALAHSDLLGQQVAAIRATRDRVVEALRAMKLEVADTDANFALFGRFDNRHAIWQGLVDRGVIIREVGPPGWLRVSVGTDAETDGFLDALREVLA